MHLIGYLHLEIPGKPDRRSDAVAQFGHNAVSVVQDLVDSCWIESTGIVLRIGLLLDDLEGRYCIRLAMWARRVRSRSRW